MNPPPPMLPAKGCVTASANAVATAASTALPPLARIDAPTSEAMSDDDTTSPVVEATPGLLAVWDARPAGRTSSRTARHAVMALMAPSLHLTSPSVTIAAFRVRPTVHPGSLTEVVHVIDQYRSCGHRRDCC